MLRVPLFYRRTARHFFYQLPDDETMLNECVNDFYSMDRRTAKESAIGMVGHTLTSVLRKITVPTLVIGAVNDRMMPKYGPPSVVRLVPHSRLAWIEQCGHLPMIEQPDVYNTMLYDFLTSDTPLETDEPAAVYDDGSPLVAEPHTVADVAPMSSLL
jgi:pimeloyl-ACP methyl ester carboxylesterase